MFWVQNYFDQKFKTKVLKTLSNLIKTANPMFSEKNGKIFEKSKNYRFCENNFKTLSGHSKRSRIGPI